MSEHVGGGIKDSSISTVIEDEGGNILVGYDNYYAGAATIFSGDLASTESVIDNSLKYSKLVKNSKTGGFDMIGLSRNSNVDRPVMVRFDSSNQKIGLTLYFSNCFTELRVKSVKSHPIYGTVVLGTDKHGSSYSDTHTVFFNVSDDMKYACPD